MNIELNFPPQTSRGSFSAVSTPIFASKYSLEALAEIYTMHSFAPFFNLKISAKIVNIFSRMNNEFPIFSFSASTFAFFLRIF